MLPHCHCHWHCWLPHPAAAFRSSCKCAIFKLQHKIFVAIFTPLQLRLGKGQWPCGGKLGGAQMNSHRAVGSNNKRKKRVVQVKSAADRAEGGLSLSISPSLRESQAHDRNLLFTKYSKLLHK